MAQTDIYEVRRGRLQHLVDTRFEKIQALADALGKSHAQVWQLLHGRRTIGERPAAEIEGTLDLPAGWLSDNVDLGRVVKDALEVLPADDQRDIVKHLEIKLTMMESSVLTTPAAGRYLKMIDQLKRDMEKKRDPEKS